MHSGGYRSAKMAEYMDSRCAEKNAERSLENYAHFNLNSQHYLRFLKYSILNRLYIRPGVTFICLAGERHKQTTTYFFPNGNEYDLLLIQHIRH